MSSSADSTPALRVDVVDPSAYTPPYDHALCSALVRAGARVRLQTSRFAYAVAPAPDGYERVERFYRRGGGAAGSRRRFAAKIAQHVPDMLRYARAGAAARAAGRRARSARAAGRASRGAASSMPSGACMSASMRSSCTPSTAACGSWRR